MTYKNIPILIILTMGTLGTPASLTRTDLMGEMKDGKTEFGYEIPVSIDTFQKVDSAIYSQSYLGTLKSTRVKKDGKPEERVDLRIEDMQAIAKSLVAQFSVPDYGTTAINIPQNTVSLGTGNSDPLKNIKMADYSGVTSQISEIETLLQNRSYSDLYHRMGALAPRLALLEDAKSPEAIGLLSRWDTVKEAFISDGLVKLDISSWKKPVEFKTEKTLLEGRTLRQILNLLLLKNKGPNHPVMAALILLDEYNAKAVLKLQRRLAAAIEEEGADLLNQIVTELHGPLAENTNYQYLFDQISQIDPTLRHTVLEPLTLEICQKKAVNVADVAPILEAFLASDLGRNQ